jgi:hypothetical protein
MAFSPKQLQALRRPLDARFIRTRETNGRELSYIEGWYAVTEANRIFGFDGWCRETVESRCVLARENRGAFSAVYIVKVRLTVFADGAVIIREGHGTGEGRGTSPGEVHEIALKGAETDATKRALATFGRPFGLALYGSPKGTVPVKPTKTKSTTPIEAKQSLYARDDNTPIPRPSTYFGRERYAEMRQEAAQKSESPNPSESASPPPAVSVRSPNLVPERIDKSVLTFGTPRRLRNKAHLRFVASQPCLVCGRQPSDPHHLRYAQPRAIGLKVSDEFTVPLCRGHHRLLHQAGDEIGWWDDLDINALEIAHGLWEQSHLRGITAAAPVAPSVASSTEPKSAT